MLYYQLFAKTKKNEIPNFFRNIALTLFLVSILFGFAKFISFILTDIGLITSGSGTGSASSVSVIHLIIPSFSTSIKEVIN